MSSFTPEDVARLAALARLELSADETAAFARQLGEILEFARQVQAVDAASLGARDATQSGDGTMLPPLPAMRDDVVALSLPRETVLGGAPDAQLGAGLFKVPRVFNG